MISIVKLTHMNKKHWFDLNHQSFDINVFHELYHSICYTNNESVLLGFKNFAGMLNVNYKTND